MRLVRALEPFRCVLANGRALLAVLGVFALASCGEQAPAPASKGSTTEALEPGSEVVARVNGSPIYRVDVIAHAVEQRWIKPNDDIDVDDQVFTLALEQLIAQKLLAEEAVTQKLDQDEDVQRRLTRAREIVLSQTLQSKLAADAVNKEAIERAYREAVANYPRGMIVRARSILTDTREEAESAKRQLDRGEDFIKVAAQRSEDPANRAEGGYMGEFAPEDLVDGLRQAAETAPIGRVTDPIQTSKGWYVLKVEARRQADPPTLEALRPTIQLSLLRTAQTKLLDRLLSDARIERLREDAGVELPEQAEEVEEPAPTAPTSPTPLGPGALAGSAGGDLVRDQQMAPRPKATASAEPPKAAPVRPQPRPGPVATTPIPSAASEPAAKASEPKGASPRQTPSPPSMPAAPRPASTPTTEAPVAPTP